MLDFTFPKKVSLIKRGWWAERSVVTKRGKWNIKKSLFGNLRVGVDKYKYGKWVAVFLKNSYYPHPLQLG